MFGLRCPHTWLAVLVGGLSVGCESDSSPREAITDAQAKSSGTSAAVQGSAGNLIAASSAQLSAADPSPSNPVTASMVIRPTEAGAGDTVELVVQVRIAGAHYVHARPHETFTPVAMNLELPAGLEAVGDWEFPTPEKANGNDSVYRNSVQLRRSLKVLPNTLLKMMTVSGELRYQVCNDEVCWPPDTLELSTSFAIKRR